MAILERGWRVRGFDLARNPGLGNTTEYGAGEFPLPVRPSARSASQSASRPPSMTRSQQTEETRDVSRPQKLEKGTQKGAERKEQSES